MTVDVCMAYILMLVSMTLTLTLNTFERLVLLVNCYTDSHFSKVEDCKPQAFMGLSHGVALLFYACFYREAVLSSETTVSSE